MRWQNCTGSLRFEINDKVAQYEPYAEHDERAEETGGDSNQSRQIMNPMRAKDEAIENPKCEGKK